MSGAGHDRRGRRASSPAVAAALLTALLVVGQPSESVGAGTHERSTAPVGCAAAGSPFVPTLVRFPAFDDRARVVPRRRDRHGVVQGPPVTRAGLQQLSWDRYSAVKAGSAHGVIKMIGHTAPNGRALGNRLLRHLRKGQGIVLTSGSGKRRCYQVVNKIVVKASKRLPTFYDTEGRPLVGILVCSGKRLGPGRWTHRTIWYAAPRDS